MQIVIEMPEDEFEAICRQVTSGHEFSYGYIAIANGTPLPKGHGELIERNKIEYLKAIHDLKWGKITANECAAKIKYSAPTIIEVDKAESEE